MYLTVSTRCPNCRHIKQSQSNGGLAPSPVPGTPKAGVSGLWRCHKDHEGQTVRNVDWQHLGCMSFIERMHNQLTNYFSARQWGWQPVTWDANASHGTLALRCTPLCTKFSLERKGCRLQVAQGSGRETILTMWHFFCIINHPSSLWHLRAVLLSAVLLLASC